MRSRAVPIHDMKRCIATSCDSKYYPGLIALLVSLKKTNPDIPVVVFDGGLTDAQRRVAGGFAEVLRKKPFTIIPGRGKFSYIGDTTLLKFEVAALEYDKALYLDADTIVTEKLDPVFDIPRGYVGVVKEVNAVKDMFRPKDRHSLAESIGIDWEEKGFNAGVFALYPQEWRDLREKALALIGRFGAEVFSKSKCQQLLNIIFAGRTYALPRRYNASPLYDKDIGDPAVIHYLCETKPWHEGYPRDLRYAEYENNSSLPVK